MELQELKQLGSRIRDHRRNRGLTLIELSQKTGLSASYLSRIERGVTSPSLKSLVLLARTFGKTIAELFENRDSPSGCPSLRAETQCEADAEPVRAKQILQDESL